MYYCIANPSARSGQRGEALPLLLSHFRRNNISCQLYYSDGPGHAAELAKTISGLPHRDDDPVNLIVAGGDGTLNEVINGIHCFDHLRIGCLPSGSGNDFARGLALPSDPHILIRRIAEGRIRRRVDLGAVRFHGDQHDHVRRFAISCGIGFDAAVCEEAQSSGIKRALNRVRLGTLSYGIIALRQILTAKKTACDILLDDGRSLHLDHLLFSAVMNCAYEGGGYRFAPDADPADGKMTLIAVGDISVPRAILSFPAAHAGKYYDISEVHHFTIQSATIRTEKPLWVHTDGEVSFKSDHLTIECLPQKLALLV